MGEEQKPKTLMGLSIIERDDMPAGEIIVGQYDHLGQRHSWDGESTTVGRITFSPQAAEFISQESADNLMARAARRQVVEQAATIRAAAQVRARIVAALLAEIGDEPTAERLAGVVVRALEGE